MKKSIIGISLVAAIFIACSGAAPQEVLNTIVLPDPNVDASVADAGLPDSNLSDSGDAGIVCVPETDGKFCTRLGKTCGTVNAFDNCMQPRTVGCGPGDCCNPNAEAFVCATYGKKCGSATVVDNCGANRNVSCGTCKVNEKCTNNLCVCVPQTDEELCLDAGSKDCGVISVIDRCGVSRDAVCGTSTCGKGFSCVSNKCVCLPESDKELCNRIGKDCGKLPDPGVADNCRVVRTLNCDITGPNGCTDGGKNYKCVANKCGCTPTVCVANVNCGGIQPDGCGGPEIDCSPCSAPKVCGVVDLKCL